MTTKTSIEKIVFVDQESYLELKKWCKDNRENFRSTFEQVSKKGIQQFLSQKKKGI